MGGLFACLFSFFHSGKPCFVVLALLGNVSFIRGRIALSCSGVHHMIGLWPEHQWALEKGFNISWPRLCLRVC